MPQIGIHAIIGLTLRKTFAKTKLFAVGLVIGSVLPDIDGYGQAYGILFGGLDGRTSEQVYHRSFTHSLLFAVLVGLLFHLIGSYTKKDILKQFGWGVATGMFIAHDLPDTLIYSNGVALFWPLPNVYLWGHVTAPPLIAKMLRSFNFLTTAIYFTYLYRMAKDTNTSTEYLPRLRFYTYTMFALWAGLFIMVFTIPEAIYDIPDGGFLLLYLFPNIFWVTWKMSETIGHSEHPRHIEKPGTSPQPTIKATFD
jgi:membrane-bound metal-dependent hydrolase YbcI (DUF457 family)